MFKKISCILLAAVLLLPQAGIFADENYSAEATAHLMVSSPKITISTNFPKQKNTLFAIAARDEKGQLLKVRISEKQVKSGTDKTIIYLTDEFVSSFDMRAYAFERDTLSPLVKKIGIKFADSVKRGSIAIEAEDMIIPNTHAKLYQDEKLSGNYGAYLPTTIWYPEQTTSDDLRATFLLPSGCEEGTYRMWVRAGAKNSDGGNFWQDLNCGKLTASWITHYVDGNYYWGYSSIELHEGENYVAFRTRTPTVIDKIIITNQLNFKPTGRDDEPVYQTEEEQEAEWSKLWALPPVKPISGHPRLYLNPDNIEEFKTNAKSHGYAWMLNKFYGYADHTLNTSLDTTLSNNYNSMTLVKIMCRALKYVLGDETDPAHAEQTILYMREFLETVRTPDDQGDITRVRGDILVCASIVYDWCYDRLTDDDKAFFKKKMISLIASKEIGWPPKNMSSVASHGGEQEIFRDCLAAGIALYDEYPLLYNMAAGRMYEEMIPARMWLRSAGRFDQGHDYAECRAYSELWADMTMQRMGYPSIYGNIGSKTMRWLIYSRMPYGNMIANGDMYSLLSTNHEKYYSNYPLSILLAASLYKDPYLMAEYNRRISTRTMGEDWQFFHLLFYDYSVTAKTWDDLPLSKYSSYPLSGISARTSWQEGFNSGAAMAFMDMHEVFIADHMHKYTGDFQIYYKGLLAMNTGTYNSSVQHNEGYSHRAVSANTMLVYDPAETFKPGWSNVTVPNDGGQRLPYDKGASVGKFTEFQVDSSGKSNNNELTVAENVKHYIGPNVKTPKISYISGNLEKAYTSKVSKYVRSMAFIDLNDSKYPAAFIVYDKIESSNASFKKTWLLHCQEAPGTRDNRTVIERTKNGFSGRLVNKTLLPQNIDINVVGGDNNQMFEIGGLMMKPTPNTVEGGKYRIEISPKESRKYDEFLNVMYVTNAGNLTDLESEKLETTDFVGVRIKNNTLYFSKKDDPIEKPFGVSSGGGTLFVAGLAPVTWQVSTPDGTVYVRPGSDSECIYLEGNAGTYTFIPGAANAPTNVKYDETAKPKIGDFFVRKQTSDYLGSFLKLDTPTKLYNGLPYIPAELLCEFGAEVSQNGDKITVTANGKTAVLTLNKITYVVDHIGKKLAYPPVKIGDVNYIYYSSLEDFLGYTFNYRSGIVTATKK